MYDGVWALGMLLVWFVLWITDGSVLITIVFQNLCFIYIQRHILNLKPRITAPYVLLDACQVVEYPKVSLVGYHCHKHWVGTRPFGIIDRVFHLNAQNFPKKLPFWVFLLSKCRSLHYMCSQHSLGIWYVPCGQPIVLTHWGWDKMAAVPQTALSNAFFLNENVRISIKMSLKFVPKRTINNNPAFIQIMAWRRSGDKSLSEPMMVNLLTHICVTRP